MDSLFNLIIMIGNFFYQNRGTRNMYLMRHFERIIELERESEEIHAINQDKIDIYEKKWEKYLTE